MKVNLEFSSRLDLATCVVVEFNLGYGALCILKLVRNLELRNRFISLILDSSLLC